MRSRGWQHPPCWSARGSRWLQRCCARMWTSCRGGGAAHADTHSGIGRQTMADSPSCSCLRLPRLHPVPSAAPAAGCLRPSLTCRSSSARRCCWAGPRGPTCACARVAAGVEAFALLLYGACWLLQLKAVQFAAGLAAGAFHVHGPPPALRLPDCLQAFKSLSMAPHLPCVCLIACRLSRGSSPSS